jgi:hypothetical protein
MELPSLSSLRLAALLKIDVENMGGEGCILWRLNSSGSTTPAHWPAPVSLFATVPYSWSEPTETHGTVAIPQAQNLMGTESPAHMFRNLVTGRQSSVNGL